MTDTNPPADRTAEIRARLDAADTPGPWEIEPDEHGTRLGSKTRWVGHCPDCDTTAEFDSGDADLIANAPADLAYLLARVEELEGQLAAVDAVHKPKRLYTVDGEFSYSSAGECAAEEDVPVESVKHFDICAHCGELEMAFSVPVADYMDSLWPCATAKARGIEAGR